MKLSGGRGTGMHDISVEYQIIDLQIISFTVNRSENVKNGEKIISGFYKNDTKKCEKSSWKPETIRRF